MHPAPPTTTDRHQRTSRAFTLIELLVVITIILLLMALLMPALLSLSNNADIQEAKQTVQSIKGACEQFRLGDPKHRYPGHIRGPSGNSGQILLQYTYDDTHVPARPHFGNLGVLDLLDGSRPDDSKGNEKENMNYLFSAANRELNDNNELLDPWGNVYVYIVGGNGERPFATSVIDDWNYSDLNEDGSVTPDEIEQEFLYLYSTGPSGNGSYDGTPSSDLGLAKSAIYINDMGEILAPRE